MNLRSTVAAVWEDIAFGARLSESTNLSPSSTTARNGRRVSRAWRLALVSSSSWMSRVVFIACHTTHID